MPASVISIRLPGIYVILYMYYNQRKFALELTQFFKSRELTAEDHTMKNYILKKALLCFIAICFLLFPVKN